MDERVLQFRVGVLVVATAIITGILVLLFESRPLLGGQYTVFVRFDEAPGVAVGTPVRKSGILIGRVSNVDLTTDGRVTVTTRIDRKYGLRSNERCRIATNALLGDSVLEFVTARDGSSEKALPDETYLEGLKSDDPFKLIVNLQADVTKAVQSIGQAGQEVQTLALNANKVVETNTEQIQRILQKSELALDRFERAMATIDEFVGDPEMKARLKKALEEFPLLVGETRQGIKEARGMVEGLSRMSSRAEKNLQNLEGFTKPLGERGDQLVTNMENSLKSVDTFLSELVEFSRSLNSGEGSLGRLVHDDELYESVKSAVENVEDVTRQLKPLVKDARVFADKIARDPSRLGLKGALDRQPTGLK